MKNDCYFQITFYLMPLGNGSKDSAHVKLGRMRTVEVWFETKAIVFQQSGVLHLLQQRMLARLSQLKLDLYLASLAQMKRTAPRKSRRNTRTLECSMVDQFITQVSDKKRIIPIIISYYRHIFCFSSTGFSRKEGSLGLPQTPLWEVALKVFPAS